MNLDIFVGKFIGGKEVTEAHLNGVNVNFIFQDGNYESSPIVDGKVEVEFDTVDTVETPLEDETPDIVKTEDEVLDTVKTEDEVLDTVETPLENETPDIVITNE